jgi:hypothetical protein
MDSEPGMPEGISRVPGDCRKGCGQTLETNEYGTVECCLCGAKRQRIRKRIAGGRMTDEA